LSRLADKTCIVTGAAAGIGRATSLRFAHEGANVIAIDLDENGLKELQAGSDRITIRPFDVCDAEQVKEFGSSLERADVLFNCAGRVAVGTVLSCTDKEWTDTISLNVTAIFRLIRAILPMMLARRSGSIINMASVISSIGGAPDRLAYGASKAAVIGITKSVARDFAGEGIRCNAICPSAVETPSMTRRIEEMADPTAARVMFNERQPVGRMGTPDEIADLATYLASDESAFMTGSAIVIDGGAKL